MSEVHVYGVVSAASPPALDENGVRLIPHRDIAALVGDMEGPDARAVTVLRTHWRVLEKASASTTVLPVRFGTVMADDRAVVEHFLERSHDAIAATLADMAGKVQLTVKGFYEEDALMASIVARSPAIARLREQVRGVPEAASYYKRIELGQRVAAEVEHAREQDAHAVFDRLRPLAVDGRLEPPSTPDSAANAAFLIEEARLDEFSEAAATLGRELAGRIRLQLLGPLPPYSFTGDQLTAGEETWG